MTHAKTDLRLADGLTVLVGPNNIGKSIVAIALKILARNTNLNFVMQHEQKECSHSVETSEGHSIQWINRKSPTYVINDQPKDRLGRGGTPMTTELEIAIAKFAYCGERCLVRQDLAHSCKLEATDLLQFLVDEIKTLETENHRLAEIGQAATDLREIPTFVPEEPLGGIIHQFDQLQKLKGQALATWGTDNLDELKLKLVKLQEENEARRAEYQSDLQSIEAKPQEVDKKFQSFRETGRDPE